MIKRFLIKFNIIILSFFLVYYFLIDFSSIKKNIIKLEKESLEFCQNNYNYKNTITIPNRKLHLLSFQKINSDTIAWITIPGTNIDWPIMNWVTEGNEDTCFYNRRNEYKQYAFEGSIYGGKNVIFSPLSELSNNLIIYGHNLNDDQNGKRFAQLMKFLDFEFAKKTPYIFITTYDSQLVYQIYSVSYVDLNFECLWIGLDPIKQAEMIKGSKDRSEYIYNVEVSENDKIITLYTCTYKYGKYGSAGQKNTRFILQGKLIKNKDSLKPTVFLKKNPNPLEPKFYQN